MNVMIVMSPGQCGVAGEDPRVLRDAVSIVAINKALTLHTMRIKQPGLYHMCWSLQGDDDVANYRTYIGDIHNIGVAESHYTQTAVLEDFELELIGYGLNQGMGMVITNAPSCTHSKVTSANYAVADA